MKTARAFWWAAPLLVLCGAQPAWALDVSPIRVELSRAVPNALVALTNTAREETRYQLRVFSWKQDGSGKMDLQNTRDVFLYPPLMALKPGERRNARIGVMPAQFGAVERTYRLIVEELPPAPRAGAPAQVRVVTRLSIPVFLAPEKPVADLRVDALALAKGSASFRLVNGGNVSQRPVEVTLDAVDAKGEALAHQRWDGWYVLAGGVRDYSWVVPREACASAAALVVKAKLEAHEVTARAPVLRGECAQ